MAVLAGSQAHQLTCRSPWTASPEDTGANELTHDFLKRALRNIGLAQNGNQVQHWRRPVVAPPAIQARLSEADLTSEDLQERNIPTRAPVCVNGRLAKWVNRKVLAEGRTRCGLFSTTAFKLAHPTPAKPHAHWVRLT